MTTARTRRRRAFLLGATSVLLVWAGTIVAWAVLEDSGQDGVVAGGGANQHVVVDAPNGLAISGSLSVPLWPGTGERLDLTIVNTTGTTLAVTDLEVRIVEVVAPQATSRLRCTLDDFAIEQTGFAFELDPAAASSLTAAGATEDELPRISMRDTDVDQAGCVGASLALEYSAIGTSA